MCKDDEGLWVVKARSASFFHCYIRSISACKGLHPKLTGMCVSQPSLKGLWLLGGKWILDELHWFGLLFFFFFNKEIMLSIVSHMLSQ